MVSSAKMSCFFDRITDYSASHLRQQDLCIKGRVPFPKTIGKIDTYAEIGSASVEIEAMWHLLVWVRDRRA